MKKRLEKSVDAKRESAQSKKPQKIAPQLPAWLLNNPSFEHAVIAQVANRQIHKTKRGTRISH
jgi:hypothetical protein